MLLSCPSFLLSYEYFRDDLKKAMAKLAAGKRALLVQDSNDAVENLAEACELLGKVYGETGKEMGDSYFLYGKALLEEARKEAGVIDNAFDGGKYQNFISYYPKNRLIKVFFKTEFSFLTDDSST